jgi:hypothetical protein
MRGMNKLPSKTRVRILNLLVEGSSLRFDLACLRRVDQHRYKAVG